MTQIANTPISSLTLSNLLTFAGGIVIIFFVLKVLYYAIFRKSIEEAETKRINNEWAKGAIQNGADPEWVNKMNE